MRTRHLPTVLALATLFCATVPALHAQDDSGQRQRGQDHGPFAGMQRGGGEITAINGDTLTVKAEDGTTSQIVTTTNTHILKGQGNAIKVSDLKLGDVVVGAGNLDAPTKTLHAAMLFATDAEQVKKMRENLGKTYIAGKVTAIDLDNLKMTVKRPDGVVQTIGFDETTSFKRGGRGGAMMMGGMGGGMGMGGGGGRQRPEGAGARPEGESITLADIKVGDNVGGTGTLKGGTFVPTQLNVATPRARRNPNGENTPPPQQ